MFGESDSESPRLPSPWEAISPSPSPRLIPASHGSYGSLSFGHEFEKYLAENVPRLAPEVEEVRLISVLALAPSSDES